MQQIKLKDKDKLDINVDEQDAIKMSELQNRYLALVNLKNQSLTKTNEDNKILIDMIDRMKKAHDSFMEIVNQYVKIEGTCSIIIDETKSIMRLIK